MRMSEECRVEFVICLINHSIDRKASARELASDMIAHCVQKAIVTRQDVRFVLSHAYLFYALNRWQQRSIQFCWSNCTICQSIIRLHRKC